MTTPKTDVTLNLLEVIEHYCSRINNLELDCNELRDNCDALRYTIRLLESEVKLLCDKNEAWNVKDKKQTDKISGYESVLRTINTEGDDRQQVILAFLAFIGASPFDISKIRLPLIRAVMDMFNLNLLDAKKLIDSGLNQQICKNDDDDDNIVELEFACPQCGSFKFGSSQQEDNSYIRYCHGFVTDKDGQPVPCEFSWRDWEDKLYMKPKIDNIL